MSSEGRARALKIVFAGGVREGRGLALPSPRAQRDFSVDFLLKRCIFSRFLLKSDFSVDFLLKNVDFGHFSIFIV